MILSGYGERQRQNCRSVVRPSSYMDPLRLDNVPEREGRVKGIMREEFIPIDWGGKNYARTNTQHQHHTTDDPS